MRKKFIIRYAFFAALFSIALFKPNTVFAHCDGIDGPVVNAAQKALETENVNLVLIWVQEKDEAEIRKAFQQTLTVRKLSVEAKQLADRYFFETLVRIHRAGEGAPYTGLKPAGRNQGLATPAADQALQTGAAEPLLKLLNETMHNGIHETFSQVMAKKSFNQDDLAAGREYVKAYVEFIHYAERLYEATAQPVEGHAQEINHGARHNDGEKR